MLYLFEESYSTFRERNESIGIPISQMEEQGSLHVRQMEPLNLSPQEFAQHVRAEVEEHDTKIVMIDGINGYQLAVQGGTDALTRKLHALGRYLKNMGVTVIFVDEHKNVTGDFTATNSGVSYLADNIVFLQHVEMTGRLQKVIGVLKKRTTEFEHTLRQFEITEHGLKVGGPMTEAQGILSGTPVHDDSNRDSNER